MNDISIPILIVGGGGAGLTASALLSRLGVDSLLVSAQPTTSILPKAHVLNQRAMEILREIGIADEIYREGTPFEQMRATAWYAGFGGAHRNAGRRIARMQSWGAGGQDPHWAIASACPSANLPQIRLEPIMKRRAEELAPEPRAICARAHRLRPGRRGRQRRDPRQGERRAVQSARALHDRWRRRSNRRAADLASRSKANATLLRDVSIHMTADLSRWSDDPDVLDPLDLASGDRLARRSRADGPEALGPAVRGVGLPPELSSSTTRARWTMRASRPTCARRSASAIIAVKIHCISPLGARRRRRIALSRRTHLPGQATLRIAIRRRAGSASTAPSKTFTIWPGRWRLSCTVMQATRCSTVMSRSVAPPPKTT